MSPWFKCYPGDFLKGVDDLSDEELAFYTVIFMRVYDAGNAIYADDKTIARWRRSNVRKWQRIKASLIAKGRIVELTDGGIIDERALAEMESLCKDTKDKVPRKFAERFAKLRSCFPKDSGNISETGSENSLNTMPLKEEEYRKKQLAPDGADAWEVLRGACGQSSLQLKELEKLEACLAGWNGEAFIVQSKWARDRFAESLRIPLKATGLRVEIGEPQGLRVVGGQAA